VLGLDFEADLRDSYRRGKWRRIPPKRWSFFGPQWLVKKYSCMCRQTDGIGVNHYHLDARYMGMVMLRGLEDGKVIPYDENLF
jgi:hypothetical protein